MIAAELDAAAKAAFACLKAQHPETFEDSDALLFQVAFAQGAGWGIEMIRDVFKEAA